MNIECYAAMAEKEPLKKYKYHAEKLHPYDVEVKISHCGICHSDIHLIDNDWQISSFPLVPGHEIVGIVTETGSDVKHLETGQRVGIGWQRSACLTCEQCSSGYENLCGVGYEATCVGNFGGFAEKIRTDSRFVFAVPENLTSENAAPLLCGGITVYAPLRHFGILPKMKVGVIGIGGLGHLALQFSRAYGCEVTAFSNTPEKEREALKLGAHRFISSTDPDQMEKAFNSLDLIINTVWADLDWGVYLSLLKPKGTLCFVGAPVSGITIPSFPLVTGLKSIAGSPIGGRALISEMLNFAARHDIEAISEVFPVSEVNHAIDKVRQNKARYRMVLEM